MWFTDDDQDSTTSNGAPVSNIGNPYLFTGQRWDSYDMPKTGLSYFKIRYHSAGLGRFVNRDPARFEGGINLYAYVSGNPVRWTDSLGLWEVDCVACNSCANKKDIAQDIDDMINNMITSGANEKKIAGTMIGANPLTPAIEDWANRHKEASRPSKPHKYAGAPWALLGGLEPCILVCKVCIGTDKLGHMFQQGWEYYDISDIDKKGDELAKSYGAWLEGKGSEDDYKANADYFKTKPSGKAFGYGGYGRGPSGVISNADLSANTAGMSMYKDIAAGKFKTICDYISSDLDEETNLNEYTPEMDKIVKGNNRR